jgi:hypothetical protein
VELLGVQGDGLSLITAKKCGSAEQTDRALLDEVGSGYQGPKVTMGIQEGPGNFTFASDGEATGQTKQLLPDTRPPDGADEVILAEGDGHTGTRVPDDLKAFIGTNGRTGS